MEPTGLEGLFNRVGQLEIERLSRCWIQTPDKWLIT